MTAFGRHYVDYPQLWSTALLSLIALLEALFTGERYFCVGQDEAACDSAELNPNVRKFNAAAAEESPPMNNQDQSSLGWSSAFSGFLPKAQSCSYHLGSSSGY